ncbi:hypothetical protein [Oceanobacillus sp. FSL H7-0719]|uniref:hypothetical protein n=1 Tax=Oceanobacillus sp. FSL H7-0719 TaxID=2954507 RepID=UPI003245E43E
MDKNKTHLFIIIAAAIALSACMMKDSFDDETITKFKSVTEYYIKSNFETIESIEIDDPYISKMGATKIDGIVNGQGRFSITLNDDYSVAGISLKEGFPERKEECKDQVCDY